MPSRLTVPIIAVSGLLLAACQTPLPQTSGAGGSGTSVTPIATTQPANIDTANTDTAGALADTTSSDTAPTDTAPTDTAPTNAATADTTDSDGGSDVVAPSSSPAPEDLAAPMKAQVTEQTRKALPAQAEDKEPDAGVNAGVNAGPDASADTPPQTAAETLDDAFDIAAAVTAPPPSVPAVEPTPPPPEFEPASLLGASSSDVKAVFGSADLLRREGRAEVWQYRLATCVVDYFVYPDADGNKQVTDWDWRAPIITERLNARQCRQDLATRQISSDL